MTSPGAGVSARTGRESELLVLISAQASASAHEYPREVRPAQRSKRYQEVLRPPWWVFGFAVLGALAIGVAYGSALGLIFGIAVAGLIAAFLVVGLQVSSPRIRVTHTHLHAGSASLPRNALGEVQVLDTSEMRDALDLRTAPATTFTLVRSWATPRGIRVDISDASDPHAAWLLSTRDPQRLAGALQELRDRMDA